MLNYEKQSPEYDFPLIFDRQKKFTKLCQSSKGKKKQKKTENYTNDGMVRESPPCDFLIFFDAKLWKTIPRIRFSISF